MEILFVAVLALIVFGPEKLPDIARNVGKAVADLRRVLDDAKGEFEAGMNFDDDADEPTVHPIREALDARDRPPPLGHSYDLPSDASLSDAGSASDLTAAERSRDAHPSSLTPIPMSLEPEGLRKEPEDV